MKTKFSNFRSGGFRGFILAGTFIPLAVATADLGSSYAGLLPPAHLDAFNGNGYGVKIALSIQITQWPQANFSERTRSM
jgi:hypothetical protein